MRPRLWTARAALGVAAALACSAPAAASVGWHQTPFASQGFAAWLDRSGDGALLLREHSDVDGAPQPWLERAALPDGSLAPPGPLDPGLVPERSVALTGGPRVVLSVPGGGLVSRGPGGWERLGRPPVDGSLHSAAVNARGDVVVAGQRQRWAVRVGGRWHVSPLVPSLSTAVHALGEDGSVVVAGTTSLRGTVQPGILGQAFTPGVGWRRLPAVPTDGPPRLAGVTLDGSAVATLVYSTDRGGVRSVTLAPRAPAWGGPEVVGPGTVAQGAVGSERGGRVWALALASREGSRVAVMTRRPEGGWARDRVLEGVAPALAVGPLGEVVVSVVSAAFDHTWRLAERDPVSGAWSEVPGRYVAPRAPITLAGDILSAHLHPVEQGNFPAAFADRRIAPARPDLVAVAGPRRLRRGAPATVHASVAGAGPVLVTVTAPGGRAIAAAGIARGAGGTSVTLSARLTRLLPRGEAVLTVDTGGREPARAARSAPVEVTDRAPAPVRLTRAQLLVNQRIAQAAVRRANAALAALRGGLPAEAVRDGSLGPRVFGPGVTVSGEPAGGGGPGPSAYRVPVAAPDPRRDGAVALSAAQLLINQRISQAAVRRANAVAARLAAGLTGRELAEGAVGPAKLLPGLSAAPSGAPDPPPGPPVSPAPPPRGGAAAVALSARQLRINQRISQAAVRRASASIALLESGLTDAGFAPGALGARHLAPPTG